MKKSIKTFLKHPVKDSSNRSANPAVIRASTILFNTMQELYQHEKKIKKHLDYETLELFFPNGSLLSAPRFYVLFVSTYMHLYKCLMLLHS